MKCRCCKVELNFLPSCFDSSIRPTDEEKTTKGNVYSKLGLRETQISGFCEYCFDRFTKGDDDDNDYDYSEEEHSKMHLMYEDYLNN